MTWPTLALALGGPPTLVPCWNVKVQVAQLLENGGTRFLEPAASSVGSSGILVCKLKPQLRKKVKTQNTEVP